MRRIWPLLCGLALILSACGAKAPAPSPKASSVGLPVTVLVSGLDGLTAIPLPTGQMSHISLPSPIVALAQGPAGSTVLITAAPSQPIAGNLALAAVSWQRSSGRLHLLSLDFTTPHQGSMFTGDGYTELDGIVGRVGSGPFALNAFHGGGIGEIFAVLGPSFQPMANYQLPSQLTPSGLVVEGNMSGPPCQPQVLALAPTSQDFLVRGTLSTSHGVSCRYFTLGPSGQLTALPALTAFAAQHPLLAAAVSPGGRLAVLTSQGQVALAASITATPQVAGNLQLSATARVYPYLAPATLFWSPHAGRLVATAAGRLVLYRVRGSALQALADLALPQNAQSVLAVFAPPFHLPSISGLEAVAQAAAAAGRALEVAMPGPYTTRPTVRLSLTAAGRTTCIPLGAWVGPSAGPPLPSGQESADGCPVTPPPPWFDTGLRFVLVPPGAHTASTAALRLATQHAWLVMPEAGWLETGTYHLAVSLGGQRVQRTVSLGQ